MTTVQHAKSTSRFQRFIHNPQNKSPVNHDVAGCGVEWLGTAGFGPIDFALSIGGEMR